MIVPASGESARKHFRRTIEKLWSLDEINKLGVKLPNDVEEKLRSVQRFAIWGSTPRVTIIETLFKRLDEAGEGVAAFYRDGKIVCWGRIFAWMHNNISKILAEKLWGRDEKGDTWEYVYFIRDIECTEPGIDWDKMREELGYNKGFIPRGHTLVKPDKLKNIVDKYGDIITFLNKLAGRNPERINESESTMSKSRYNAHLIQSLKQLKPIELLEVLGEAAFQLAAEPIGEGLSKDDVARLLGGILKSMDKGSSARYLASAQYPLLINDLRRLGVIEAGDPSKEWRNDVKASVSPLARRVGHIIKYCASIDSITETIINEYDAKDNKKIKECSILGGAYIIINSLLVPVGSPDLHQVLKEIYNGASLEELADRISFKIGAKDKREVLKILEGLKSVITTAAKILEDSLKSKDIPLLYVPLDLRKTLENSEQNAQKT